MVGLLHEAARCTLDGKSFKFYWASLAKKEILPGLVHYTSVHVCQARTIVRVPKVLRTLVCRAKPLLC